MKIFMIGGTGLLGCEAASELIKRNHEVVTLALPPVPQGIQLPKEMKVELGNFIEMPDAEIIKKMEGCEGLVFAAGIDERVEGPAPIYELYKKFNIDALGRLLKISKKVGVKNAVICGSYFSHFARTQPERELTKWHPYIRSRIDQENLSLSFADGNFDVSVLQIPYVFGSQPGRKPVWLPLVEQLLTMKKATLYPKGGTAMVTARQVGQAIAGAVEQNKGGNTYPLGYFNMTWKEMLGIFHEFMGTPDKKIKTVPTWMYALGAKDMLKKFKADGIEPGLDPIKFTKIQCSTAFIDKNLGCVSLGVEDDDIKAAIGESVKLCMEIINGKTEVIGMKAE